MQQKILDTFKERFPISEYDPSKQWPPDTWLFEDVFLTGGKVNYVFGQPKSGKSRLLLWLLVSAMCGIKPFGLRCDKKINKVLWIRGEETERNVQWRAARYAKVCGGDPDDLLSRFFIQQGMEMGLESQANRWAFEKQIADIRPDLVVIDPLRRLHGARENSSDDMGAINNAFRHWTDKYDMDMCILHHTGKLSDEVDLDNPMAWGRGSSDIIAIMDSGLFLQRIDDAVLLHRAGRHAPDGKIWKIMDQRYVDKDEPAKTDLGFRLVTRDNR